MYAGKKLLVALNFIAIGGVWHLIDPSNDSIRRFGVIMIPFVVGLAVLEDNLFARWRQRDRTTPQARRDDRFARNAMIICGLIGVAMVIIVPIVQKREENRENTAMHKDEADRAERGRLERQLAPAMAVIKDLEAKSAATRDAATKPAGE